MVATEYDHIWDCCCDHGFLGTHLLSRQAAKNIHFVDIVPELIKKLELKLQQLHPNSNSKWQTHSIDVADLPLQQYQAKHLVIIAGVGGDFMSRMIVDLYKKHKDTNMDFLLCSVHRQFALRKKLIELNFSLKKEILVEDKQRFYEVILVSSKSDENKKVHPVGDKIWQSSNVKQAAVVERYLENTLNYYLRIQKNNSKNVDEIIGAYRSVAL